jgi:hypothetical protein
MRHKKIELSIIIVNYNTRENLKECLLSIQKHIKGVEYEVIVVDNSSCDGSKEMVKRLFPTVLLIENKKNFFFTRANNQGIRRSKGEYILLLNSDTIIMDNSIKKMLAFMNDNPKIGGMSCKILFPNKRIQTSFWNFRTPINEITRQAPFRRKISHTFLETTEAPHPVDVISGAFMLLRRQSILEVGLCNEQFLLYYTEDDICHKLKKKGWEIYHFPNASIIHRLFTSSKKIFPIKMALIRAIDTLKYCEKYYNLPIALGISFFLGVDLFLEILKLIIKSVFHIQGGGMKNFIKILIIIWLLSQTVFAHSTNDWQFWNTVSVKGRFNKNREIKLEEEFRFSDNMEIFYYHHTDISLTYKPINWLSLGLAYRQIYEKKEELWKEENRPHFNGSLKWKWNKFKFKNRSRVEYRIRRGKENAVRYRNKLTFDIPGIIGVKPYLADEIFIDCKKNELSRNRLYFGVKARLIKSLKTNTFYLWQKSKKKERWATAHVIGVKLGFSF